MTPLQSGWVSEKMSDLPVTRPVKQQSRGLNSVTSISEATTFLPTLGTHSGSSESVGSLLVSRGRCSKMLLEDWIRKAVLHI